MDNYVKIIALKDSYYGSGLKTSENSEDSRQIREGLLSDIVPIFNFS